MRSDDGGE
jgi:hypothetical protein